MKPLKKIALLSALALSICSCRNTEREATVAEEARQATIDSIKADQAKKDAEVARQKTIDSMKVVAAQQQAQTKTVVVHDANGNTTVQQRKGWSGAAKGAVIGAGVGAISGAVIDKKKPAQGAIIGGLAGAGLGAGTGAVIDDSKKKKEQK